MSHIRFISDTLHIYDTVYVKQQIVTNSKLDLNRLTGYGFNIFDLKGLLIHNTPHDSILALADRLNSKTGNYSFLMFSIPIFNKEKNLAYIRISKGSDGSTLILEKPNDKWLKKFEIDYWAE